MTYKLKDGRVSAFFGDTNVVLELASTTATRVHFMKNKQEVIDLPIENREVTIPDFFFDGSYNQIIFWITNGKITLEQGCINITKRAYSEDKK